MTTAPARLDQLTAMRIVKSLRAERGACQDRADAEDNGNLRKYYEALATGLGRAILVVLDMTKIPPEAAP